MDLNGTIYTNVSVETYDVIKELCRSIGIIDKSDSVVVHIEDGKIVEYSLDIFDQTERRVLYDQPFDVKYATTLLSLFIQTREYLHLPDEVTDKVNYDNGDYRTAYRLELKRKQRI